VIGLSQKVNKVCKLYTINCVCVCVCVTWLAIPGCESLVVVNKLGGMEGVLLLLNHVCCTKSGTAPAILASTGLVSLSDELELAIASY